MRNMEQNTGKFLQGKSRSGKSVWSFRIPNSTNDYIELSTYGCSLQGLYVHDGDGALRSLIREMGALEGYCLLYTSGRNGSKIT